MLNTQINPCVLIKKSIQTTFQTKKFNKSSSSRTTAFNIRLTSFLHIQPDKSIHVPFLPPSSSSIHFFLTSLNFLSQASSITFSLHTNINLSISLQFSRPNFSGRVSLYKMWHFHQCARTYNTLQTCYT